MRAAQNLDVRIAGNEVRGTKAAAVSIAEVAGSLVRVDSNRIAAQGMLIRVQRGSRQRLDPDAAPPSPAPTLYEIEDNTLAVGAPRPGYAPFGADGIVLEDVTFAARAHLSGVDSFIVRRNEVTLDGSGNAITVIGDRRGRARLMDNRLSGPAVFTGIYLDESIGTRTRDNRFAGFSDENVEVYLSASTERCVVLERQARVWDDGVGNTVTARELRRNGQ
ncbi:MAG: hypothetical protein HC872_06435 [Gammaproteobacteria bacterium]|nr:hypothetical protein [Gammaproteobacteria bacterium]